ncbi:TPA: AAA family ATPase [Vibrio cholerae]|uniref:AAA family ATPase n=1 Tax=Vibrio cholerae TaxID=666 RepID=UPI001C30ED09|nr:AAA family ATPase [Vibrio cholerae]EIJ2221358.1 AAA family ATPase [Vibrio cholerae]EJL6998646.1 AAA family ATPase [Vibrio cholerae]EKF9882702.1 AAA family ATPase [Vibrio cholerae]
MIKNIKLKFGRADGLQQESIEAMPITVFVGPNNSGKSKILSEIQQFCANGSKNVNNVIIDNIELEGMPEDSITEKIENVKLKPNPGEAQYPNHIFVGKRGQRLHVQEQQFRNALVNPNDQPKYTCSWYLSYNTLILNGNNRINLIQQQ